MPFGSQKTFGIDISDYSVEILELEENNSRDVRVRSYARSILERGIVEDGVIRRQGDLASIIHDTVERSIPHIPITKRVIASLPESKTYLHIFRVPIGLTAHELGRLVLEEAFRTLPLEASEFSWDFITGPEKGNSQEVLFAAAPRDIVSSYKTLFLNAGFELIALDLESASIVRTISRIHKMNESLLVVDIGSRITNLTAVDGGGFIRHSFSIPVAGSHLTHAISTSLRVPFESAEHLKMRIGLNPDYQEGRIMLILQKVLVDIVGGVKRVLDEYTSEHGEDIKTIFLTGGGSLLPNLGIYLSENTDRTVQIFHPREISQEIEEGLVGKEHPVFFTNVIGLALRGLEPHPEKAGINLLPREKSSEKKSSLRSLRSFWKSLFRES